MRWISIAVIGSLAACAQAPDGLLVVTGDPEDALDPSIPATVDVIVGVDRGLEYAELTGTRAFVVNALPADLDRAWDDPSQPYSILLDPFQSEVYVVLRGEQVGHRFGANLAAPATYPGDGLVSVVADLHGGGGSGVCPYGVAEEAGYVVEILPTDPRGGDFDCDQDGVVYPDDCVDYDESIKPSIAYPPSFGLDLPEDRMCCNGLEREPANLIVTSSGPASCSIGFTCAGANPFLDPKAINWAIVSGGDFCDCIGDGDDPLFCLGGAHPAPFPGVDEHLLQPYCDLSIDDDGALCPDQISTIRDRLRDLLPATPASCSISIWWQTGPVGLAFRGQGSTLLTQSTDDCDADMVFVPVGPRPPTLANSAAIGWYILEVAQPANPGVTILFPMHVHPNPAPGCDRPLFCGFE